MSSHGFRDVLGVLLAALITLGFWFAPDIHRSWKELRAPPPLHEPVSPVTMSPAESKRRTSPVSVKPVTPVSPRSTPNNTAQVLARLAQTCAFWSARADDTAGKIYRDRSCRDMRRYAASTRQAVPAISVGNRPPANKPRTQRSAPHGAELVMQQCLTLNKGSVNYRKCRANVSKQLKNTCQRFRQADDWQHAERWCSAYDNYQIVD